MPYHFRRTPAYRVAISETLAQAKFASGDFNGALRILDETDVDGDAHLDWYRVSIAITKTHVLLAQGDYSTAKRCAVEAVPIARDLRNSSAERMLQLLATEASLGDTPSIELPHQFSDCDNEDSVELQAAASLVRGQALRAIGALNVGSECLRRGIRLLQASNAPAKFRANTAVPEDFGIRFPSRPLRSTPPSPSSNWPGTPTSSAPKPSPS